MYVLHQKVYNLEHGELFKPIFSSGNIDEVRNMLREKVLNGIPEQNLIVMKKVKHQVKCVIVTEVD